MTDENDANYRVTANELRQFIERFERLEAEKKDISDQQKEVMSEAKSRGYDTKVIRKVIALRKRDKDDIAEEEAVLEMYKEALGMSVVKADGPQLRLVSVSALVNAISLKTRVNLV